MQPDSAHHPLFLVLSGKGTGRRKSKKPTPTKKDGLHGSILDSVGGPDKESSGEMGSSILDHNSYGFMSW